MRAAQASAGLLLVLVLSACEALGLSGLSDPPPAAFAVTVFPTASASPVSLFIQTPTPASAPAPGATPEGAGPAQEGWRLLRPGLEFNLARVPAGEYTDWLLLLRVDSSLFDFRVRYAPERPFHVREWHAADAPEAVVNGGFFDASNRATGLVVADGVSHGSSYRGFGGMFYVRDSVPGLVWLAEERYRPDSGITQAVQGYPMLVSQGQAIDSIPEDGKRNRRSFIGIDSAGRVVLGVSTAPVWTLTELAGYLAGQSGLGIRQAMNLDGGASSGMWVNGVPEAMLVDSLDPVPAVVEIVAR